jgi:hypothetical protein
VTYPQRENQSAADPAADVLPCSTMPSLSHSAALVGSVFDRSEADLITEALHAVAARAPADAEVLSDLIADLRETASILDRQRPLRKPTQLGGEPRDEQTLISHLCTIDGLSGDLALPLKSTLSRTYLLTKIMFLRGFVKATTALEQVEVAGKDYARLSHDLREELAQSIYTLLAEELFLALLRKPDVALRTKRRAADQLITIWDDAALEIDDFAPLLESAWHARNRINANYGALLGASETFRLVCEDCSPEVLDFFARDNMSGEEIAAFEEFLFNMTTEELRTLRAAMVEQQIQNITPAWAAIVLGRQMDELEHSKEIDPMALYRSYQRRQLAADFRMMSSAPGPRRTAEAYLMIDLLDQQ